MIKETKGQIKETHELFHLKSGPMHGSRSKGERINNIILQLAIIMRNRDK